jgi:Cd2+/Zn2+-exporting ATPase
VFIGADDRVLGGIVLSDQERPETRAALATLQQLGIRDMAMLTGDAKSVAELIAARVGITDIHAELLPADKVARVNEWSTTRGPVAFVGDGVNDAPALARADLGIAMGAAATPAALETADVALLSNDLRRLPWLITHARRTHRIVWQNIIAALGTKVVFLVLTMFGFASLWIAIAADTGVSLLVTLNALRLLRNRE